MCVKYVVFLLSRYGVLNTPLSPLVSEELLDHYNCFLSGSQIEASLCFNYEYPEITTELLLESIHKAIETNIFPNIVIDGEPLMPAVERSHK